MQTSANPVLVDVVRGGLVESQHRGAFVVRNAAGHVLCRAGDIERRVFARSAVKLLQALPLVTSGAADHWGFDDAELALACASHNGEDMHVQTAASMLRKAGLDEHALECGIHAPYFAPAQAALLAGGHTPCALHNNCSGKHAGFVALGAFRALSAAKRIAPREWLRGYVAHDHALMNEVSQSVANATSVDLNNASRGIDGCSIPTHAVPLDQLALAYARVASGEGLSAADAQAAVRLRRAIARVPQMVGGTDRFDTVVMQRLGERVCCKVGAEGVYCAALPDPGLGVAIKMDDGNNARAVEVVMATLIQHLVTLDEPERAFVHGLSNITLRNWRGIEVGALRASPALRNAL